MSRTSLGAALLAAVTWTGLATAGSAATVPCDTGAAGSPACSVSVGGTVLVLDSAPDSRDEIDLIRNGATVVGETEWFVDTGGLNIVDLGESSGATNGFTFDSAGVDQQARLIESNFSSNTGSALDLAVNLTFALTTPRDLAIAVEITNNAGSSATLSFIPFFDVDVEGTDNDRATAGGSNASRVISFEDGDTGSAVDVTGLGTDGFTISDDGLDGDLRNADTTVLGNLAAGQPAVFPAVGFADVSSAFLYDLTIASGATVGIDLSATIRPVPLPAGALLLIAGLGTFGLVRRRR